MALTQVHVGKAARSSKKTPEAPLRGAEPFLAVLGQRDLLCIVLMLWLMLWVLLIGVLTEEPLAGVLWLIS